MSDDTRITDLEIRLTDHELALEGLSASSLSHQNQLNDIKSELQQIREMLRQMAPAIAGSAKDEPPPPHY
jgi:uncharacterized coiled-coil protein SlyX